MSDIETNKKLTLDTFKAIERGDADHIAGAYADNGQLHTMGQTLISRVYKPEQIRQFAGAVLESFPQGISSTIHHMTAEGDRVAVEATGEGMHVSGKPYVNQYHFAFRVLDGRIAEVDEYVDTRYVYETLGL